MTGRPAAARLRRGLRLRRQLGLSLGLWLSLGLGLGGEGPVAGQEAEGGAQGEHPGRAIYERWCAGCHGSDGTGDGVAAAYMLPRPRDFTGGTYQIRTTASGELPTDADILRVIDVGMPGTAMPGWEDHLSLEQREALVDYLKSFSRFFDPDEPPEPIEIADPPGADADALARGRALYERFECADCHGVEGRGDGPSAPTMDDENGFPIRPADLTENWNFNGGGSVEAIYTRLLTGLNGTPMPSLQDVVAAGQASTEDIWDLAHYVRSLSPEEPPRPAEVLRARRTEAALPTTPDDPAWADVERAYVPLVGQVIAKPRKFAPTVDGVWVQALHDGTTLALRLS
ncbi:MAG: c-type cytochrome, partial [Longimicrobiales bacterium]